MSSPCSPRPARLPGACPCGLPAAYDDCCGRLHCGQAKAATPEQLMRSRFSAFAVRDEAYLLRTWHPATRPATLGLDPAMRWLSLDILGSTDGGPFGGEAIVEFRARYTREGRPGELRERSRFRRHHHAWTYIDGTKPDALSPAGGQ
jgi:SEC-C motif-containing protein